MTKTQIMPLRAFKAYCINKNRRPYVSGWRLLSTCSKRILRVEGLKSQCEVTAKEYDAFMKELNEKGVD